MTKVNTKQNWFDKLTQMQVIVKKHGMLPDTYPSYRRNVWFVSQEAVSSKRHAFPIYIDTEIPTRIHLPGTLWAHLQDFLFLC